MSDNKFYDISCNDNSPDLYSKGQRSKEIIESFHIGITYLDKNNFGLKHLCKAIKNNSDCIKEFYSFLESSRKYDNVGKFIKDFVSHNNGKNNDKKSQDKTKQLIRDYHLEIECLIHLHCKKQGKGRFVVHGFQIGNTFEIVWLDPKHEIHSLK